MRACLGRKSRKCVYAYIESSGNACMRISKVQEIMPTSQVQKMRAFLHRKCRKCLYAYVESAGNACMRTAKVQEVCACVPYPCTQVAAWRSFNKDGRLTRKKRLGQIEIFAAIVSPGWSWAYLGVIGWAGCRQQKQQKRGKRAFAPVEMAPNCSG